MLHVVPSLYLMHTGEDKRAQLPSPATMAAYKYASLPGWTHSSGAMHTKPSSTSRFCSWGFTITATENNNGKAWDTISLVPDRQGQTQHTAFSFNILVDSLDLSTGNQSVLNWSEKFSLRVEGVMGDLNISLFMYYIFKLMKATEAKNIIKSALNNVLTRSGGGGGRRREKE